MKQQFIKDTADTFRTYIYECNRKIVPASASITLYEPGGAPLVEGAVMEIAQDGLLFMPLTQENNSVAGLNYKASIEYSYSQAAHYLTIFYDIVRSRLAKVITDDDLAAELPQLRDSGWSARGAAEGGTDSEIVDSGLKRYGDDYFTGGTAYRPETDETREVVDFEAASGTVAVEAFSTPVAAGERYILTRSFAKEIQRAFEKLEDHLVRLGRRPHLVLDPYDLREPHILLSVAEACKGLAAESRGLWWELWKEYDKKAQEAMAGLAFKYDSTGDGFVNEPSSRLGSLKAGRR